MIFLQSLIPSNNNTLLIILSLLILSSSTPTTKADERSHSVENCEKWCLINECEDNPTFMMQHCKAQCDEWKSSMVYGLDEIDDFYDLEEKDIDGNMVDFAEFEDSVVLITNVASYCSKTEQHYKELVKLHDDISKLELTYTDFDILAFPSNQFQGQEPEKSPSLLKKHIQETYDAHESLAIMSKIDVNGSTSSKVYKYLKSINGPFKIKDCFYTYFIIDGWGNVHEYTGLHPKELYEEVVMFMKDHERAREEEEQEF